MRNCVSLLIIFSFCVLAFAQNDKKTHKLLPFTSDGCSLPDFLSQQNYESCCLKHDISYCHGGSISDKNQSDIELVNCLKSKGAYSFTTGAWQIVLQNFALHRWGTCWEPLRPNTPLTPEEKAEAFSKLDMGSRLIALTKKQTPMLKCPTSVINTLSEITVNKLDEKTLSCYTLRSSGKSQN